MYRECIKCIVNALSVQRMHPIYRECIKCTENAHLLIKIKSFTVTRISWETVVSYYTYRECSKCTGNA